MTSSPPSPKLRDRNYLIAVLSERSQVEAAYRALQSANLPIEELSILGAGHGSADDFGLINPNDAARQQTHRLRAWLLPFGFVSGFAFNWLTGIEITAGVSPLGNHILGGLIATAAALLGAQVVGTITGWSVSSGDAIAYRNRLNAGQYLLIVTGPKQFVRGATGLLRQYEPETLQGYVEPV